MKSCLAFVLLLPLTAIAAPWTEKLAEVERLEVRRAEQPPVRLQRQGQDWVLIDKAGYPADQALVRTFLTSLAGAQPLEHVAAEAVPRDIRIILQRSDAALQRLYLASEQGPEGRLLYLGDEARPWRVDGALPLPLQELNWLDRRLIAVPPAEVRELQLHKANGSQLVFFRHGDAPMRLEQLPGGQPPASQALAELLAVFADLRFSEVVPAEQLAFSKRPRLRFTLRTQAGARLDGAVYRHRSFYWLTLNPGATLPETQQVGKTGWLYRLEYWQVSLLERELAAYRTPALAIKEIWQRASNLAGKDFSGQTDS